MVELETLNEEDKQEVRAMIESHFKFTGSDPAEWILENWEVAAGLFVKVMPKDYKAVLQKQKMLNGTVKLETQVATKVA
jgi:glutamate synthase (NADPH/NADH) large chain